MFISLRVCVLGALAGLFAITLSAQADVPRNITLEGYVYEDNNSGYLNEVRISVLEAGSNLLIGTPTTNADGFFSLDVPEGVDLTVRATKKVFEPAEATVSTKGLAATEAKVFVKIAMGRQPGYALEVTLSKERDLSKKADEYDEVDAIQNSRIEVYNNTRDTSILVLESHPSPYFSYRLEQGNHYTLLIRSPGYFTKRIESFVNVDGCILCMDGVSEIGPGVSDNLAYGNDMGTLLANIELQPLEINAAIALNNIYYTYNSYKIQPQAALELEKVVEMLRVNPGVSVELGSYTDSRGDAKYNQSLSQKRAESAIEYITSKGIDDARLSARGYGEQKITNKCVDSVECTDEEHASNRRTELRITDFTDDAFADKTLVQIIEDEKVEALLADVLSGGEYVAPLGDAVTLKDTTAYSSDAVFAPEEAGYNNSTALADGALDPKQDRTQEVLDELEALKGDLGKSDVPVDVNAPDQLAAGSTHEVRAPRTATEAAASIREARVMTGAEAAAVASLPPPVVEDVPLPPTPTTNMPETTVSLAAPRNDKFSGYRVLVFQSPVTLGDESGELFFKYGTLREDELADGSYGYMSQGFDTDNDARAYLDEVSTLFPEARVLRYVNGFIIENSN